MQIFISFVFWKSFVPIFGFSFLSIDSVFSRAENVHFNEVQLVSFFSFMDVKIQYQM